MDSIYDASSSDEDEQLRPDQFPSPRSPTRIISETEMQRRLRNARSPQEFVTLRRQMMESIVSRRTGRINRTLTRVVGEIAELRTLYYGVEGRLEPIENGSDRENVLAERLEEEQSHWQNLQQQLDEERNNVQRLQMSLDLLDHQVLGQRMDVENLTIRVNHERLQREVCDRNAQWTINELRAEFDRRLNEMATQQSTRNQITTQNLNQLRSDMDSPIRPTETTHGTLFYRVQSTPAGNTVLINGVRYTILPDPVRASALQANLHNRIELLNPPLVGYNPPDQDPQDIHRYNSTELVPAIPENDGARAQAGGQQATGSDGGFADPDGLNLHSSWYAH